MIIVFGSTRPRPRRAGQPLPRPGETVAGFAFAAHAGGKGANQALAARRVGANVMLVAAVGRDDFANTVLRPLRREDRSVCGRPCRRADRRCDDSRRRPRRLHHDRRRRECVRRCSVGPRRPSASRHHRCHAARSAARRRHGGLGARRRARGARTVLNAAPAQALPPTLLAGIDVLIVNEIEAAAIATAVDAPSAPDAFSQAVHRRFGCATIVTLGAEGALMAVDRTLGRRSGAARQRVGYHGRRRCVHRSVRGRARPRRTLPLCAGVWRRCGLDRLHDSRRAARIIRRGRHREPRGHGIITPANATHRVNS